MYPQMLVDFFVYVWMVVVSLPLFAVGWLVSPSPDADNITFLHIFSALTISLVSVDKGIL